MIKVDQHVHTHHSSDGRDKIIDILKDAKQKGISHLCTTDHLDMDLKCGGHTPIPWKHINLDDYKAEWLEANATLTEDDKINFRFGIEAGWSKEAEEIYKDLLPKYDFDCVINSVHFVYGWDVYFPQAFFFKSKDKVYSGYLDAILNSLDAPYEYDVVAHIGYVTRNAPYKDKSLKYEDYPDKFDAILKGIIARNKALEVNTHTELFPSVEILKKYYEYGGRKLSFGSDSHHGELIKNYENTCKILKEIGFTHFSVFTKHKETLIPIE
ncbi:MAG: histidinol-phosphatase HisJ family protein [Clostridia bacterium]|nr:histidinol-phosphatase HisJ family protein [Clostridia bacterium]